MAIKSTFVRIAGGKRFELVNELQIRVVQQFGDKHNFTQWGPEEMQKFLDSHKQKLPSTPPSRPSSERPYGSASLRYPPVAVAMCTHGAGTIQ